MAAGFRFGVVQEESWWTGCFPMLILTIPGSEDFLHIKAPFKYTID